MLERIMREIRRRTRVVGNFPDGQSALTLVGARLRHWPEPMGRPLLPGHDALNRPRARTAAVRGLGLIATTDFPRGEERPAKTKTTKTVTANLELPNSNVRILTDTTSQFYLTSSNHRRPRENLARRKKKASGGALPADPGTPLWRTRAG